MIKKLIVYALLIPAAFILMGCSNNGISETETADGIISVNRSASISSLIVPVVTGTAGPGADYAVYMPPDPIEWNGELLLFVHGYVFPPEQFPEGLPPLLQDLLFPEPILDHNVLSSLLSQGFAIAYSSFSETGYAVKDGAIRTRQLRGIFIENFGKPENTYLVGSSLGGTISLMLTEKNSALFSGSLLLAGYVGGGQMQIDYIVNSYLLFNYYFNGILPPIMEIPETYTLHDLEMLIEQVFGVLNYDIIYNGGLNTGRMLSVLADGIPVFQTMPGASLEEMLFTVLGPIAFTLFGANDILDRTQDRLPFDNSNTVYEEFTGYGYDELELPEDIRFEAKRSAANYLRRWYEPTGKLKIPVLTFHNEYDPIVPYYHEQALLQKVSANGTSGMLEQWKGSEPFGHGNLSPAEIGSALEYLRFWVMTGIKPPLP